jgi:PST family polysaccharide transporter
MILASFFRGEALQPFKNLIALGSVQLTNYLLPLATLPYLIRVVGIENFGMVSLVQSVMLYLLLIADYGFNFTTTMEISVHKENSNAINHIVSGTMATKFLLLLLSFISLLILQIFITRFHSHGVLFLFGFSIVIGQAFFPMWFFQGVEKLKYIAWLNLISRCILTALIFIFINEPSDYIYILPIYGFGNLVATLIGLMVMILKFNVKLQFPQWIDVKVHLKKGWPVFISSIANNTYVNSGIVILSFFASDLVVGFYSVADKILLIFRQMMVVVAQAVYPAICRLMGDRDKLLEMIKGIFIPFFVGIAVSCLFILIFPSFVTMVLTGKRTIEIVVLLRLLSLAPIIMVMGVPFNQLLMATDHRKESMRVYLMTAFFSIMANVILAEFLLQNGIAMGVLLSEIFITYSLITTSNKKQKLITIRELTKIR